MTADLTLIRTHVGRFAAREIAPRQAALEHGDPVAAARELVAGLDQLGLLDLGVAAADDRAALVAALQVLAGESASVAALLFAHAAGRAVAEAAGATTAAEAEGTWGCPIYADLSDADLQVVGGSGDGGVTLLGKLELVAGAPVAAHLLVPARIDGELELLAVPTSAEGVDIGPPVATLGLRGCPTADVVLRGVQVAAAGRLARGARAREVLATAERRLRGPALAICAGIGGRSLRGAVDYARERYQGGSPISEHQEVRRLLAGMIADHGLAAGAAERLAIDPALDPGAAALFASAKERIAAATCDGVQLLGGYGYMEDYQQERHMRDAKQAQVLLGRCEVARQALVASWLADGAPLQEGQ